MEELRICGFNDWYIGIILKLHIIDTGVKAQTSKDLTKCFELYEAEKKTKYMKPYLNQGNTSFSL